ncbi:MAG: cytochrome c family protein [Pseudomonadota bacterium]
MKTMEINKIVAGVICAVLLVIVVGKVGGALVHPQELEEPVYPFSDDLLAAANAPASAPAAPAGPEPILAMLASASIADGEAVFKKCVSCHDVTKGGPNKVGPNLYGIVGASFAHMDGFAYSAGMAEHGGNWGWDELNEFLFKPRDYISGTKMSFAGLSKASDRANVIAYLNSMSDNPLPYPDPAEVAEEAPADEAVAEEGEAAPADAPEGEDSVDAEAESAPAEGEATGETEAAPAQ